MEMIEVTRSRLTEEGLRETYGVEKKYVVGETSDI